MNHMSDYSLDSVLGTLERIIDRLFPGLLRCERISAALKSYLFHDNLNVGEETTLEILKRELQSEIKKFDEADFADLLDAIEGAKIAVDTNGFLNQEELDSFLIQQKEVILHEVNQGQQDLSPMKKEQ